MWFETKRALLRHLGKNENDNKLVDRLILRGDVYMEDGMYYIVDKDAIIEELRERVSELEGKITLMKESNWDLEEAKIQWEYWEKECRRYWRLSLNVIDICYNKFKQLLGSRFQESKEDFKEWIIEIAKEMDKGGEKSE